MEENEVKEWEDPIVAEVRAVRDAHAKKFNYDPRAIFEDILKTQEELKKKGYKFTSLPPKLLAKRTGTDSY